jgi:endonuclease/exonuclease/phosphatase (EEP) superfamily protein YafD
MTSNTPSSGSSLTRLLFSGSLITGLLTVFGFFGGYHWLLDIASHFRLQYLIYLIPTAAIFLIKKRYKEFSFNSLAIAINFICIIPIYFDFPKPETDKSRPYTALVINLQYINSNFDLVNNYLDDVKPDILLLMEFSPSWKRGLKSSLQKYRSHLIELRNDPFGIGVYSNFPILEGKRIDFGQTDIPSLKLKFEVNSVPVTFYGVHWMPPFGRIGSDMRNAQMEGLQKLVTSDSNGRVMVLGDINMTPWSPNFQSFESNTKLKNVRRGFGILATWPAKYRWFGIPLDHGFVSSNIIIKNIETGPNIGSDHLPLKISFGLKFGNQ